MKKLVARNKLLALKTILSDMDKYFSNNIDSTFAYIAMKNLKSIEQELDVIDNTPTLKTPDGYAEYDNRRMELIKKNARKDDNGDLILTEDSKATFDEDGKIAFESDMKNLSVEFKELLDEVTEVNSRREEFMLGESEIEIYPIELTQLPKLATEGKSGAWIIEVMDILDIIIKE